VSGCQVAVLDPCPAGCRGCLGKDTCEYRDKAPDSASEGGCQCTVGVAADGKCVSIREWVMSTMRVEYQRWG
jgi:hypothetical protein